MQNPIDDKNGDNKNGDKPDYSKRDGTRRLYGRAKGKRLSPLQAGLVETLLPKVRTPDAPDDPLSVFENYPNRWLEVGFGGGEHLVHQARTHPDIGILGIEPFLNGVSKTLTHISADNLQNIRLHHGDARPVMDRMADASFDKIFVLFPDPWPKPRHFKRRILNAEFIAEIKRLLKPGGEFRFASDIISYVDWTLTRVIADGGFEFEPQDASAWRKPPKGWPGTRYEAKAFREGRICHYFEFIKK
ncbi:MAG: tRNA (guanosine(46)-N7)-methyltransferase TrmB [Robiginitomaculum sp.]